MLAIENVDEGVSSEVTHEDGHIINAEDRIVVNIREQQKAFKVLSVDRVDHILYPNVPFDYRLFAVGV